MAFLEPYPICYTVYCNKIPICSEDPLPRCIPIRYFTSILKHWINDFYRWSTPLHGCFLQTGTYIMPTRILLSDTIAQPASSGCSSRVWVVSNKHFAKQNEQLYRQLPCLRTLWRGSILEIFVWGNCCSDTQNFKIKFIIHAVSFKENLEADGYFSTQKFSSLQPQQAGRVGANSQVLNQVFQIRLQKRLLGFAKTRYSAHKLCRLRILTDAE